MDLGPHPAAGYTPMVVAADPATNLDDSFRLVPAIRAHLDSNLGGTLPCVVCGYQLQGLSIRSVCPECGTAVRATILYQVDPQAEEFRPLNRPRLTAICLILWSSAALAAALACWLPRLVEAWAYLTRALNQPVSPLAGHFAVASASISGLALLGLIRPTPDTARWKSAAMLGAIVAHAPLVWTIWQISGGDLARPVAYFTESPDPIRIWLRVLQAACLGAILLGVRPIARDLVKRSLVLRTGRVDRQTILAMVAVVCVGVFGDSMRLWAQSGLLGEYWLLGAVGTMLVALASILLTVGLAGALADSWRIHKAILIPSPSLRQVIGGARSEGRESGVGSRES